MNPTNILATLHVQNTVLAKHGSIHWKHKVSLGSLSETAKFRLLSLGKEQHQQIVKECYADFTAKNHLLGTVHISPGVFYEIFYEYLVEHLCGTSASSDLELPNGCCSTPSCAINIWYDLLAAKLKQIADEEDFQQDSESD